MKTRLWLNFGVILAVCSVSALVVGGVTLAPQSNEVSGTRWHDPTLLAGPDGQPRWKKYAPSVDEADQRCVVASPPAAEVKKCMDWVGRVVNPGVLPADLSSHLLALERWPKYGGEDVFVTWYVTGGRLIYIVEGNADMIVFTALLSEDALESAPDNDLEFAVCVAESVLASGALPHPEAEVHQSRSNIPGVTAGSWVAAALEISRKNAEGRLSVRGISSPTVWVVRFLTDRRFTRFQVIKAYPGSRFFGSRSVRRFHRPPAAPSGRHVPAPELVIPTVEPASEPEDEENE